MPNSTMNRINSRLHLDKKNGWIAGVCAGFANFIDTDPAFVRVGVIITALFLSKIVIAAYRLPGCCLTIGNFTRSASTTKQAAVAAGCCAIGLTRQLPETNRELHQPLE